MKWIIFFQLQPRYEWLLGNEAHCWTIGTYGVSIKVGYVIKNPPATLFNMYYTQQFLQHPKAVKRIPDVGSPKEHVLKLQGIVRNRLKTALLR